MRYVVMDSCRNEGGWEGAQAVAEISDAERVQR